MKHPKGLEAHHRASRSYQCDECGGPIQVGDLYWKALGDHSKGFKRLPTNYSKTIRHCKNCDLALKSGLNHPRS